VEKRKELDMSEADAQATKSEGQALLDRMLAQCNRYNGLRQRLDVVCTAIAPGGPLRSTEQPVTKPAAATSFFDALRMLADGNDKVAEEFEKSIAALERLF
jgi:hypothetical protein